MQPTNPTGRLVALLVVLVIFGGALVFTLTTAVRQTSELHDQASGLRRETAALCTYQKRAWDIQHLQILDDATPQKPSEVILRAFPAFRQFFDPTNPLYAEVVRSLHDHSDRKRAILGPRPTC